MTDLAIPGQFSPTSLELEPGLPYERWIAIGQTLRTIEHGIQFWLGDWYNYGEASYGDKAAQAVEIGAEAGYEGSTVQTYAWVAGRIEPSRRLEKLAFSHHQSVASLEPDEQDELLRKADENDWAVRDTREAAQELKAATGRAEARPAWSLEEAIREALKPWTFVDQLDAATAAIMGVLRDRNLA
jgi:hypothetical protein